MDSDGYTNNLLLLAPVDDELTHYDSYEEVEDKEKCQKRLLLLNLDTFWEVPEKAEIMREIFSRVAPRSLLRFKCLSKKFLDFTEQHLFVSKQFDNTMYDVTGFFGQIRCSQEDQVSPHFDQIEYINLKSKHYSVQDPMLEFIMERTSRDRVRLIDSCNGLLLCTNINSKSEKTCFVCNPFTKEKVALPYSHQPSTKVNHALIADLDDKGYLKYKVVCLITEKGREQRTKLLIFSSETGEWEEITNADFPPMHLSTMMGSKVLLNGSLYWDCFETHILVCHLHKNQSGCCFELIEAPHASLGRCLWKFYDKLLCYCHSYEGDFPAWCLSTNGFNVFEWKPEGSEMFEIMSRDISLSLENLLIKPQKVHALPPVRFKIIAHDPVLNMVYFWHKDSIFSYRLGSEDVEKVCSLYCDYCHKKDPIWRKKIEPKTCVLAHRHILARIQTAKKGKSTEVEGEMKDMQKDMKFEVTSEKGDELASMHENCAKKVKSKRRKGKIANHKEEGSKDDEEESSKSFKKDDDDLISSLCEDSVNCKVRPRHGKAKRIDFSLLQLDEE